MEKSETRYAVARFLLVFCLGWIGSYAINHSRLKPQGWKSRTFAYFFLSFLTLGLYSIIVPIYNLVFDPTAATNVGYIKE